jgi:hypothetical protein
MKVAKAVSCSYISFLLLTQVDFIIRCPDNGFLFPDPFPTLYNAYWRDDPCFIIPRILALELEDGMIMGVDSVVGLLMMVEEVSAILKEVEKESLEDERINLDDIPMATSDPEVDELIDDKIAHLILAEDMGVASEGEVVGLLGESSKTPSFVDGKKGKECEEQVESEVQYDQDIPQHYDVFTGGDEESSFEGFDEDKPHAGMGVHSVTLELSTVIVICQNILLPLPVLLTQLRVPRP